MKYSLNPREILRAKPEEFPEGKAGGISRGLRLYFTVYILESQYRHSYLPISGFAAAGAYAAVTAVEAN